MSAADRSLGFKCKHPTKKTWQCGKVPNTPKRHRLCGGVAVGLINVVLLGYAGFPALITTIATGSISQFHEFISFEERSEP